MANGDTIVEIKTLLSEKGAIKTQTALRLSLELQSQMYEKQEREIVARKELESRIAIVENKSIVLWVEKNPKLSISLFVVYLLVSNVIDLRDVVLQVLGVK